MTLLRHLNYLLTLSCFALAGTQLNAAAWHDVEPADLAATECPSDPDAEAEILYKHVRMLEANPNSSVREYYVRIKLYKESAVAKFTTVGFLHSDIRTARNIKARVLKPNGSIEELDNADVHQETGLSTPRGRFTKTSFALPQVAVGDIVEYQYKLVLDEGYYSLGIFFEFQDEWPTRLAKLEMSPYRGEARGIKWLTNKCSAKEVESNPDGSYTLELRDLPAYPEEPFQEPDRDGKVWIELFLVMSPTTGNAFWKSEANKLYKETKKHKITSTISETAESLTKGITDKKAQLAALDAFCRSEIRNTRYAAQGEVTKSEKKKAEGNTPATKVLANRIGTPGDINALFCTLARSIGFDARLARVSDRNLKRFSPTQESLRVGFPDEMVAIKTDEGWSYYQPGMRFLDPGTLHWSNQAAGALIADKSWSKFEITPVQDAHESARIRKGTFTLDENGTLQGSVEFTFTGQKQFDWKNEAYRKSPEEHEKVTKRRIRRAFPNAKISNLTIYGANDPLAPARYSYDVTVPNYAEVLGDRIFLNVDAFEKTSKPKFTAEKRYTRIYGRHRASDVNECSITLPEGYRLEEASAPKPVEVNNVTNYRPVLKFDKKSNTLLFSCEFESVSLLLDNKYYKIVKAAFDEVHRQKQHSISIKQTDA